MIQELSSQLLQSRNASFKLHPQLKTAMSRTESVLQSLLKQKISTDFKVKCSVGNGNWAAVPWVCALNPSVTNSTQEGHYLSILFRNDLKAVFVGLGIGVTKYQSSGRSGKQLIDDHVAKLRMAVIEGKELSVDHDLIWDSDFDLKATGRLPDDYKRATIFTRMFEVDNLLDDEALLDYLVVIDNASNAIKSEFIRLQNESEKGVEEPESSDEEEREEMALETILWDERLEDELLFTWGRKKNLILQGPPGVGKTFWSNELPFCVNEAESRATMALGMPGEDAPPESDSIFRCQFHQSMSYEDFVQGYRPTQDGGFELRDGIFVKAVKHAHETRDFTVLVIDEINRGNISKIFGELLSLVEADKRDPKWSVTLPYSGEELWIPERFYILGMMNTADRSISMVDYALRRRFGFIDMVPGFDRPQFEILLRRRGVSAEMLANIRRSVSEVNQLIDASPQHGSGFQIGHSYFIPNRALEGHEDERDWYKNVIKYEVAPLLREYWFDDLKKAAELTDMFNLKD